MHAVRTGQPIAAAGLAGCCEAVGGDAYLLTLILHHWNDERCIAILRTCRRALTPDGRLLVIELLIPPGNERSYAKSQDVNMLVNLGGRERTEEEYGSLFAAAGFTLTRTVPTHDGLHIIEGVRA